MAAALAGHLTYSDDGTLRHRCTDPADNPIAATKRDAAMGLSR